MAGPANDPAGDLNAPLYFPLHSDRNETDPSGSSPDAVSAGGRGRMRARLTWLATLLALIVVGSAVAFLLDDGGAPAFAADSTTRVTAADPTDAAATEQVQPAAESQPPARTEPADAEPAAVDSTEPALAPAEPEHAPRVERS